jgi:hypothetical protein
MENNKISAIEYINNNELLEVSYIPFDQKMQVVSDVLSEVINSVGGLNTTLLRRVSTEVFIETITNIDMGIVDENGLSGFDQLCYYNQLNTLKTVIGNEYIEFETILKERISDYIRIETNPAVTISSIYNQLKNNTDKVLDYVSNQIQNLDIDDFVNRISETATALNGGGDE